MPACLALAACGGGGTDVAGPVVQGSETHAVLSLEPGGDRPYPSDLFTVSDPGTPTGRRLDLAEGDAVVVDRGTDVFFGGKRFYQWLNELDGASTFAPAFVPLSGPIDPTSLPGTAEEAAAPGSAVFLVDLQPGSPHAGERHPATVGYERYDDVEAGTVHLLRVQPWTPLRPGNRYGLVVTAALRGADGLAVGPSAHFEAVLGRGDPAGDGGAAAGVETARTQLAPLLEHLAALDRPPSPADLAVATVFTTASSTTVLRSIRDFLRSPAAPALALDLDPDGDGDRDRFDAETLPRKPEGLGDLSALGSVLRGTFDAPDVRGPEGRVVTDAAGVPVVSEVRTIPFLLALPVDEARRPYPVVVLQHGHGGRKEFMLYVAGYLAERGLATAAIDAPGHGEQEGTGNFVNFPETPVVRGSFLQAAANQLRFVQALEALGDLDLDLDLTPGLGYLGESLGGLLGGMTAAVEPGIGAAVINVAGGGMGLVVGAFLSEQDVEPESRLAVAGFRTVMQALLESISL